MLGRGVSTLLCLCLLAFTRVTAQHPRENAWGQNGFDYRHQRRAPDGVSGPMSNQVSWHQQVASGPLFSEPVIDDVSRVYLPTNEGTKLFDIGKQSVACVIPNPSGGTPALNEASSRVFVSSYSDGNVRSYENARNCRNDWTTDLADTFGVVNLISSPLSVVDDLGLVFALTDNRDTSGTSGLAAIDMESGAVAWSVHDAGESRVTSLSYDPSTELYFFATQGASELDTTVYCVDGRNTQSIATYNFTSAAVNASQVVFGAIAVHQDGHVVMLPGGSAACLVCERVNDSLSFTEAWYTETNQNTGNLFYASPALDADGNVYAVDEGARLHKFKSDGTHEYIVPMEETFVTIDKDYSSPTIVDDTIYVGSTTGLHAHLLSDGSKVFFWKAPQGVKVVAGIAVDYDGTLVVAATDGVLRGFSPGKQAGNPVIPTSPGPTPDGPAPTSGGTKNKNHDGLGGGLTMLFLGLAILVVGGGLLSLLVWKRRVEIKAFFDSNPNPFGR